MQASEVMHWIIHWRWNLDKYSVSCPVVDWSSTGEVVQVENLKIEDEHLAQILVYWNYPVFYKAANIYGLEKRLVYGHSYFACILICLGCRRFWSLSFLRGFKMRKSLSPTQLTLEEGIAIFLQEWLHQSSKDLAISQVIGWLKCNFKRAFLLPSTWLLSLSFQFPEFL